MQKRTSQTTMDYLTEFGEPVLEWPARSSDINPIENFWVILARDVYTNSCQFNYRDHLCEAILAFWDCIEPYILVRLADSMKDRFLTVIEKNGARLTANNPYV